jgi:mercuric ion binding protein
MRPFAITAIFLALLALDARAGMQTLKLDIKGMDCPTCPLTVKVALKKVAGVTEVKVDYKSRTAEVTFDDEKATPQQLAKSVSDAGYPATVRN